MRVDVIFTVINAMYMKRHMGWSKGERERSAHMQEGKRIWINCTDRGTPEFDCRLETPGREVRQGFPCRTTAQVL